MAHGNGLKIIKDNNIKMDEIKLFDKIILSGKREPEIIEFNNKEIPNHKIAYEYKYIATLKELIINLDKKIKKRDMRENKEFYIIIMAHLIAYYIIKKMNNIDLGYAKYLLENHKEFTKAIYNKLLGGDDDRFEYFDVVWTNKQIENAFIEYIVPKLEPFFKI